MVRKTREDYLEEKEAKARADLVRSARGGRDYLMHGRFGGIFRKLHHDTETERLAQEAAEAGDDWRPSMPGGGMNAGKYVLLTICLGFLGYIIVQYGLDEPPTPTDTETAEPAE